MSVSESRTKPRVQLGSESNDPHFYWRLGALHIRIILSNSNHLLFLLPFLLSTFPAHTSRNLASPLCLMEAHLTRGCRGPSSSNDTAVHLCISLLPLIREQSWGYLFGLQSFYNELALETSSRQKSNILTLYLSNL